jgi:transposase-like protein
MSAFAREHGMNVQRLMYWRKRVGSGAVGDTGRSTTRAASRKSKFVPAVVVRASVALSVHLCRGVIVEAESANALEPGWLSELQRALEGES